jgi:tetratricopeptide (TPR) repeat protein
LLVAFSLFVGMAQADGGAASAASPHDDDGREARALVAFQSGRELMAQKRYAEACHQFEESQKLDPGVGTMLNLGYCYEKLGKTASAWATYRDAAAAAQEEGRLAWESAARERVARLEGSLLRVVIEVQPQTVSNTLNVLVDGTSLPKSVWGQPAPLYPGQHEVRAIAADRRTWTVTFEVNAEHVPTVIVPVLDPVGPPGAMAESAQFRASAPARGGNARRTAALVLGGVGVAALGVTTIFGSSAISTYQSANADCAAVGCGPAGHDAQVRAYNEGTVATVAAIGGGVALVGAAILWFAPPSTRWGGIEVQATLSGGTWGASLRGVW